MNNSADSFSPAELKARFNPEGSPLRRQQERMLSMVVELDRICRKHDIPYFLYGGTLLGAVRHNGFIPWDDDLDVALLYDDYKRLMEILPGELPSSIVLQNNDTDPNYFYFFAKLRDKNSYLEELSPYDKVFKEKGVYIDIFPFSKQAMWTHMVAEPLQGHTFKIFRTAGNLQRAMKKIRFITKMNRLFTFPLLRAISRLSPKRKLTYDYGIQFHITYNEKDIFPLTTHVFEGVELSVPWNSHALLTTQYGDYMKLPDLDKVETHVKVLEFYD